MRDLDGIIKSSPHPEDAARFLEDLDRDVLRRLEEKGALEDLIFVFGFSPYLARNLLSHPEWIEEFFVKGELTKKTAFSGGDFALYWRREHVRLGVADLTGALELVEVLEGLSDLADETVELTASSLAGEMGLDRPFSVIGLGKLGGRELNYYSDIDLMYLYEKNEKINGLTAHEVFSRFFSELTKRLSAFTPYGRLYNVDLRLRPQGRKGLIALPLDGYEIYYQNFGRTWERAVLLKARCVAGSERLFGEFYRMIQPFVYRKYLDYEAIEEIRDLKNMIDNEARKTKGVNIKTGIGGIREIEFVVQAFQLAFGGREPWIRERNTLIALHRIYTKGLLGAREYDVLARAYMFYRRLENRLQMVNCVQTHLLPEKKDELRRIAVGMGFSGEDPVGRFLSDLEAHRKAVREIFEGFLARKTESPVVLPGFRPEFESKREFERLLEVIAEGRAGSPLPEAAKHVSSELLPRLVDEASRTAWPLLALKNLADFLEIMRHSKQTFYTLLKENEKFREVIISIFGTSQFLTRILMVQPELLDFLFEEALTELPPPLLGLVEEIRKETQDLDYQGKLNHLRRLKQIWSLKIGVGEITGVYTILRVFNEWSKFAEATLILLNEWLKGSLKGAEIVILALGKLGGREITYHSDLDIVFLGDRHESHYADYYTWFIRSLTLQSSYGQLFEVDVRLRPFGTKGVMVSTPESLRHYFERHARAWERLAFSKARIVVGSETETARKAASAVEDFVYGLPADGLEGEVKKMRLKLENEFGRGSSVKYSEGGLVDVEFIAQLLSIKHGLKKTSTLSALCAAKRTGVLPQKTYAELRENYLFLRRIENLLRLIFYPPLSELPVEGKRLEVLSRAAGSSPKELLERFFEVRRSNRRIFNEIVG